MKKIKPSMIYSVVCSLAAMVILAGIGCSRMMDIYNDRSLYPLLGAVRMNPPIITPYLWIANSQSNTVSQIDTRSGMVIRQIDISSYASSPPNANPSRTAVDYNFNCWVALRGNGSNNPERVLKIDADTGDVTPGPPVGALLRGVAINYEGNVWVSAYMQDNVSGKIQRMLVDAKTMAPINTFSDPIGSYGMAIGPRPTNKLFSNAVSGILRFNSLSGTMEQRWNFNVSSLGGGMIYGIACDLEGNVWNTIWAAPYVFAHQGGYQCPGGVGECDRNFADGIVAMIDVRNVVVDAGGSSAVGGRGICVDRDGNIWAAFHDTTWTGPSYIVKIDKLTKEPVLAIAVGVVTVGVTADESGNIWAVNMYGGGPNQVPQYTCPDGNDSSTYNGTVTRINTLDNSTVTFPTCGNNPYTYSDMAGFAMRGIVMRWSTDQGDETDIPIGVFAINNNLAYAFSENVTLNIRVTKATHMQFSNDGGATWSGWEPYNNTKEWTLTPGNGTKTVLGQFRNGITGPFIEISDSIMLRSETRLKASDGAANDQFGSSVAVSGDGNTIAAVGGGKLYIYKRNGAAWDEKIVAASDAVEFSESVGISSNGTRIVVGAEDDSTVGGGNLGSVYVYEWVDHDWVETKIVPTVETEWDGFGSSVAISTEGNIIIVGAELDDIEGKNNQGSVFVFSWGAGSPDEVARILANDGGAGDNFGCSVSISSGGLFATVAVGARGDDDMGLNAGAMYLYSFNGTDFDETKLTAINGRSGDRFGTCVVVSADGNSVGAGAPNADSNRGFAYRYNWNGSTWVENQLSASDRLAGDLFGTSMSLSSDGKIVAIGAPGKNSTNGSVYTYQYAEYYWIENQFTSSLNETDASFGSCVSISSSGAVMAISAPKSDVNTKLNQGLVFVY